MREYILIIQVYNVRMMMQRAVPRKFNCEYREIGYKIIFAYKFISMYFTKPDFFSSANKSKTKLTIRDMTF